MAIYQGRIHEVEVITAVRNPQIRSGRVIGTEFRDRGGAEVKTPRKAPLESTWKRANASQFE